MPQQQTKHTHTSLRCMFFFFSFNIVHCCHRLKKRQNQTENTFQILFSLPWNERVCRFGSFSLWFNAWNKIFQLEPCGWSQTFPLKPLSSAARLIFKQAERKKFEVDRLIRATVAVMWRLVIGAEEQNFLHWRSLRNHCTSTWFTGTVTQTISGPKIELIFTQGRHADRRQKETLEPQTVVVRSFDNYGRSSCRWRKQKQIRRIRLEWFSAITNPCLASRVQDCKDILWKQTTKYLCVFSVAKPFKHTQKIYSMTVIAAEKGFKTAPGACKSYKANHGREHFCPTDRFQWQRLKTKEKAKKQTFFS